MSLSFGDLSYRTQRLTVGGAWSQTKPVGQWRFFGRVAIDRDLKSDDLRIKLGPTAASLGTVEVPRPQRTSWNATLGLSLPKADDSLWAVNVGMGGPNGKSGRAATVSMTHPTPQSGFKPRSHPRKNRSWSNAERRCCCPWMICWPSPASLFVPKPRAGCSFRSRVTRRPPPHDRS